MIFVDTSALLAFLDRDASRHVEVVEAAERIFRERSGLTHSYVLVEAEALVHRRVGAAAARRLLADLAPVIGVDYVTADVHVTAVEAHLRSLRRRSSLVDQVSFEVMRRRQIETALGLDDDFRRAGFECIP